MNGATANRPRTGPANGPANPVAVELAAVRARLADRRRAVFGLTVAMGVVVLFAMGTAASEVRRFALHAGFGEFAATSLDPVVGFALLILVAVNAWIADAGRKPPKVAQLGVHFAGLATLLMNCWPSFADRSADGVLLHMVMPGLLIIFAAAAPRIRRILAEIIAGLREEEERIVGQIRAGAAVADQQATARAREAEQAALEHAAARQAEAERLAARERWAEQEASERRIAEARALAEIEADRLRAAAEAEIARAAAEAELLRSRSGPSRPRATRKKAAASTPTKAPDKDDAVRLLAEAMRSHHGSDPYEFDWQAWSRKHGGGKTFWFAVRKAAESPVHLAEAANA